MAEEMRKEDQLLAQRLSNRGPAWESADQAVSKAIGDRAGYLREGVSAVYDPQPSEQKALEQAMRTAGSITICGIAPRSLVEAMQRIAKMTNETGVILPWRHITYVTPAATIVFATGGKAQRGSIVQKWQSALNGIRNCVRQMMADVEQSTGNTHVLELSLLGVSELFLEVVLLIQDHETERQRLWVSVGPSSARDETLYLLFDEGTVIFDRIRSIVETMTGQGVPIVTRQVDIHPAGIEEALARADPTELPPLPVRSLEPFGAHLPPPSCTPAAITVLRSAAAGEPIVLLKRRTRFTDTDDFDKLSLLSGRILEEDLAGALGVQLYTNRSGRAALDAMWIAYGKKGRLRLPLDAFVRAAQRDVFVSCGLDIAADRFVHRGCQFLEREQPGMFLFFCIFEVVLFRRHQEDELELAEMWNGEQLVRVNQDSLYTTAYKPELNRLLIRRQDWLQKNVFDREFDLIEERDEKAIHTQREGGDGRSGRQ